MEHPRPLSLVLPHPDKLSGASLGFLDGNFDDLRDLLLRASNLTSHLKHDTSHLHDRLLHLRTDLTKHAVSWISTSLSAKNSLDDLRLNLESLSLVTSLRQWTQTLYAYLVISFFFLLIASSFICSSE